VNSASTWDEIKPLVDLCKAGRLFEVQAWIAGGKPLDLSPIPKKGGRKSPLRVAIDLGFHSLVQVLLKGGASTDTPGYSPLEHCLSKRRLDLVALLVDHGVSVRSVDIETVFETWDPNIMEFFIERGADVEIGKPLAWALINRIRTALFILKRHMDRFPTFPEQANIALRHHCGEGDMKWVSLLLYAGADPLVKGPDSPDGEEDPEEFQNALEIAALCGHQKIFRMKKVRDALDPSNPSQNMLLTNACHGGSTDLLQALMQKGFDPVAHENCGTALIQSCLARLPWAVEPAYWLIDRPKGNLDGPRSRERMKMIHLLAQAGARWLPAEKYMLNEARRTLLKMTPDYTTEFVWIMSKYNACSRSDLHALLKHTGMRAHTSPHRKRIDELLTGMAG